MAAQTPPASNDILLSAEKTRRDYRVSLALLVAGIILTGGVYGFEVWANTSGVYPISVLSSVFISAIGGVGSTLILVGAIFTGINWSLLRKSGRAV